MLLRKLHNLKFLRLMVKHSIIDRSKLQIGQIIRLYKVTVTENKFEKRIIQSCNTTYTFEDLAFKNAVLDEIVIKIRAVPRSW